MELAVAEKTMPTEGHVLPSTVSPKIKCGERFVRQASANSRATPARHPFGAVALTVLSDHVAGARGSNRAFGQSRGDVDVSRQQGSASRSSDESSSSLRARRERAFPLGLPAAA